ncbi:hypothetical protein P879_02879 [Paragonimus westermani]|uniref:Uncharacterized protein n=1 Tax=Paragonimus westermani TaxID=34504 RepID=A0A8T0DUH9_9TREM|nr:hypothetical protein P879_02879 [Paragonimus westermani]
MSEFLFHFVIVYQNVQLKLNILECLEILLGCLSSTAVLEGVIPFLSQTRTTEPTLLSCILAIDKHLLAEKKFGLTCTVIAEKLLPPLMDVLTAPSLNLNEFRALMDMLRLMLDTIDRHRTCELILEDRKLHSGSCTNIRRVSFFQVYRVND